MYRMTAASPEILLEAFQVLDPEGKGYVTKDYISTLMMDEGEPFTQVNYSVLLYFRNVFGNFDISRKN